MGATAEGRRLTEAHRLAQARLGAETVSLVLAAWPLLQLEDLDGTFPKWLRVLAGLIRSQRRTSAALAANYVRTFRALELGVDAGSFTPALADSIESKRLATSLLVTGPVVVRKALARGVRDDDAMELAQAASAGAAMRHVLNGGRDTVMDTVASDGKALGWARTTSGSPCSFCAMLVSRGPVYKSEAIGGFQAHDHCSCGVEPVYRDDAPWRPDARRYADLWEESTAGLGGDEARSAFRQALAAQA